MTDEARRKFDQATAFCHRARARLEQHINEHSCNLSLPSSCPDYVRLRRYYLTMYYRMKDLERAALQRGKSA